MARPRINASAAPVSWRDGVHLATSPIWCDARRARDVCFVSNADLIARVGHGQIIASPATLARLGARPGDLSAPPGRPFTLGRIRLELVATGHSLGAAALWAEVGGRRLLYAGVVGRGSVLGGLPELRSCDVAIVRCPYGLPQHRFPPRDVAIAELLTWVSHTVARGERAAVLVTHVGKGLDAAAVLAAEGHEVAAHRTIHHAAQKLRAAGHPVPPLRRAGTAAPKVEISLWKDRAKRTGAARTVVLSGMAATASAAELGTDAAIAWSSAAGREELLAYLEGTKASSVYLIGRCADAVAAELGDKARLLGPPKQMSLFGAP